MAPRTIETKAIISAEDRTGPAFAAVVQHMARMEDAARHAEARVKLAGAVDRQTGSPANAQRAALIDGRRERLEERAARREEIEHLRGVQRMQQDISGRQTAIGIAGAAIAEKTAHFMHTSLETYREFDNQRRYGKAVMGISDEDQEPLIRQAIHGGGTSKYNDIQWLEAQRELAARGLNRDQVLALTGVSATVGQAMDKSLPEAARALEGGMFGFGKDTSTYEKAVANAKRTADLQVKSSKVSGMTYEDIVAAYKYGATPFRIAGLSEEQLLAFAGVGKKGNMPGDEMGTAARALVANLLKPTAGARTAMMANGIDYSKYQNQGAKPMDAEAFSKTIAQSFGVALSTETKAGLQRVFNDKSTVADAAKFMPAIMKLLADKLTGDDAKSKKSIAGEARRYRDASMSGVDVQKLFMDLMAAMARNPTLANAVFGSKQGGRIEAGLGDPGTFLQKLEQLVNESQGYAQNVSDARMAGFDGAVSRFEGAVKNLESAIPRAFDADGKGGLLTGVAGAMGRFTQALTEAPPPLQRLGTEAGVVAAAFAGFKGAEALMGGFGLKGAAVELIHAAHALTGAAGKEALANGVPGVGVDKLPTKKPRLGAGGHAMKVLRGLAIVGSVIEAGHEFSEYLNEEADHSNDPTWGDLHPTPERPSQGIEPRVKRRPPPMGGNAHRDQFQPPAANPYGSLYPPGPPANAGGGFRPIGALDPKTPLMAAKDVKVATSVDVTVDPPPPMEIKVTVTSSSELLRVIDGMKTLSAKLSAQAKAQTRSGPDTAPGGLGETSTGQ